MLCRKVCVHLSSMSDRKAAKGLSAARELGIKTRCIEYSNFNDDHGSFEKSLLKELLSVKPDLICLAGFLRILSKSFINSFPKKLLIFIHLYCLNTKDLIRIVELYCREIVRLDALSMKYAELDGGTILGKTVDIVK